MKKKVLWAVLVMVIASSVAAAETDGAVLADEDFFGMEAGFRVRAFNTALESAELSETQTFLFVSEATEHVLSNLVYMDTGGVDVVETTGGIIDVLSMLVSIARKLQLAFPDVSLYNEALVAAHCGESTGFIVAPESLWLWAENHHAVLLPVFFYDTEASARMNEPYLLCVVSADEMGYYALYNDREIVLAYLEHVELGEATDVFRQNMIQWLAGEAAEAPTNETLGVVQVKISRSVNVRADSNTEAEAIGAIRPGHPYYVRSIAENGWYEIILKDGVTGFVSPKVVRFQKK